MSVGENIARLRRLANLTQTDFATKIKKSKATVNHYEKGINNPPIPVLKVMGEVFTKEIGETVLPADIVSEGTAKQSVALGVRAGLLGGKREVVTYDQLILEKLTVLEEHLNSIEEKLNKVVEKKPARRKK